MAPRVDRIFGGLKPGRPGWRMNWSIYDDPGLFHPAAKLFIRVERQTLLRLPASGDIVFTVRIYHDPLAALSHHAQGAALAAGLKRQLLSLDPDQLGYKGLTARSAALAGVLEQLANR